MPATPLACTRMKDIIGHSKQKKYFKNLLKNKSLSHAYLFTGPDMVGKKLFATSLYELLNNRQATVGDPDLILLDSQSEVEEKDEEKIASTLISIDSIRKIKFFLSRRPYYGPYKLVVIDDAHMMTSEASNALLKALEEPTSSTILVLVSSKPTLLPQTIRSRAQEVKFGILNEEEMSEELAKSKLSTEDKEFILKISMGRIGLVKLLKDKSEFRKARTAVDDLRKVIKMPISEKMQYAQKLTTKKDYQPKIGYWLDWVYANLQKSPNNHRMVTSLLHLNGIISQAGLNHRLAIENFLVNL